MLQVGDSDDELEYPAPGRSSGGAGRGMHGRHQSDSEESEDEGSDAYSQDTVAESMEKPTEDVLKVNSLCS